jgi:hypothetical protein
VALRVVGYVNQQTADGRRQFTLSDVSHLLEPRRNEGADPLRTPDHASTKFGKQLTARTARIKFRLQRD